VVRDTQSTLDRVELSIDAAQWRTVYPVDGIADGREERYEIDLGTETGAVQIRATDALNNVSAALVEAAGTPRRRDR